MEKLISSAQRLLMFFFIMGVAAACKQPETIVVDRNPETAAERDTLEKPAPPEQDASFRQLNIGESVPISSFDPLLASNIADMHAIQLIYEGLVRFNEDGNIVPAIAQEWSTSNGNRTYTFHLRSDVFFHDSNIFGSGTGRKLTAEDIQFVFRRMAKNNVSDRAAHLFMNIAGFEAYYREQQLVHNRAFRQLDSISGISAPSDTTVVFNLNNPDPDFLQKLATPLAVIYPEEAVGNDPDNFSAVGTGPFTFAQQANDSTFVFAKFQDYYAASDVELNRVDIVASDSESALWEAMQSGDLHYLPVLGPQLTQQLLTDTDELSASLGERYALTQSRGEIQLTFRRYTGSNVSQDVGADIAKLAEPNLDSLFADLHSVVTDQFFNTDESKLASMFNMQIRTTAADGPFEKLILQHLEEVLSQKIPFTVGDLHIPTRETGLFFTQNMPLIPGLQWEDQPSILSFTLQPYTLAHQSVEGISTNQYPWWINFRDAEIPPL